MRPRVVAVGEMVLVLSLLARAGPARAVYLDAQRTIAFRARFYSEAVVAAERSEPQTNPTRTNFQLIAQRNFASPELDANLTRFQRLGLDDWSFRLALWGFYDGIYDYGTSQYDRAQQSIRGRITFGRTDTAPITRTDTPYQPRKTYAYQPDPVLGRYGGPGQVSAVPFRINELYTNVSKGPVFVRIGRQAISWGESDTVALLDANNPFNLTLAVPGLFQDVDEARIPLWTARTTVSLFDRLGAMTSGFVDAYLVPGSIDTTVGPLPLPLASPYSPPQDDPQALIDGLIPPDIQGPVVDTALGGIQLGLYNHLPSRTMAHSRWGVRLGAVVDREYTTSLWYYRTFNSNPVPRFLTPDISRSPLGTPGGQGPSQIITELVRKPVDVFGVSTSWFSAWLNGIVRTEVEYFNHEAAFVPSTNIPFENLLRVPQLRQLLADIGQTIPPGKTDGSVAYANFLRFELGYDRFFFLRALNPHNSFTWVTAYVGQWNLSETFTGTDYRLYGQQKLAPGGGTRTGINGAQLSLATISRLRTVPEDFVDLYAYESFVQTHLETDYWHGRLRPALTAIIGLNGTYAVPVGLTYRCTDALLFDLKYVYMGGAFAYPTGLFRDRSQLSARVTMLLN